MADRSLLNNRARSPTEANTIACLAVKACLPHQLSVTNSTNAVISACEKGRQMANRSLLGTMAMGPVAVKSSLSTKAETKAQTEAEAEAETKAETVAETAADTETETKAETEAETMAETRPRPKPRPRPWPRPRPRP